MPRSFGVPCYRTPVGEAHVAKGMDEHSAVIGGEGNGGVMFPDIHVGRDAMVGAALVLSLMAEESEPLSVLLSRLPRYEMVKKRAPAEGIDIVLLEKLMREEFGTDAEYDNRDGIRVNMEEGWVHVRLSNTEPIVRIFAEAATEAVANQLSDRAVQRLEGVKS